MAIDLPKIVKAKRLRRRAILLATFDLPSGMADDLFRLYNRVPRAWAILANEQIVPAYKAALTLAVRKLHDSAASLTVDDVPGLGRAIDDADEKLSRLILRLTPELRDWTVRAEAYHRRKFVGAAKTAANVDLSTILTIDDQATTLRAVLEANVSLIRSVSDDIRKATAESVFRAFTGRRPIRELAKELNEATGLGRRRSLIIARDQTTKLAATLDRNRQEEIGITDFVWRHSGKVHYRPHHLARDGKVFPWKGNNLGGDLPGVAINCGCKAQAFIGDPEALTETAASEAYTPGVKATAKVEAGQIKDLWAGRSPLTSVEKIYEVAQAAQDRLATVANRVAKLTKSEFVNPGIKGRARLQQKIDQGRIPAAVTDVVRGGFKVETPAAANRIIRELAKDFELVDEGWFVTPDGYFDRKVLIHFENGTIAELQFWEPSILKAKQVDGGHSLYERARTLPNGDPEKMALRRQMQSLYAGASDRLPVSWKAVFGKA